MYTALRRLHLVHDVRLFFVVHSQMLRYCVLSHIQMLWRHDKVDQHRTYCATSGHFLFWYNIYLLTGYEWITSLWSPRSIVRVKGTTDLAIPEYTVYKYCIIPKNTRLIVEWSPQNDKDQYNHLFLVFCIINLDILMLFTQSFIRVWFFSESKLQHKYSWWLQVLWKFWIILEFLKFWNFLKLKILWKFWNIEP